MYHHLFERCECADNNWKEIQMEYVYAVQNPTKLTFNFWPWKRAHSLTTTYALVTCAQGIASSGAHNSAPQKRKRKATRAILNTARGHFRRGRFFVHPKKLSVRTSNRCQTPSNLCFSHGDGCGWQYFDRWTLCSGLACTYETESVWWPNQLGEWRKIQKKIAAFPIFYSGTVSDMFCGLV